VPVGPLDELVGCKGTMDVLTPAAQKCKSKVVAPRNPKRLKGQQLQSKVKNNIQYLITNVSPEQLSCLVVIIEMTFFQVSFLGRMIICFIRLATVIELKTRDN